MTHQEALTLIEKAAPRRGGIWADMGAGSGIFTLALGELVGPEGKVYAVDKSPEIFQIKPPDAQRFAGIFPVQADFTHPLEIADLDGILMANALHFVRDPSSLLRQLAQKIKPGGHLLLVEYDSETANPWVPYPVSRRRFRELAEAAGLTVPEEIGRMRSRYHNGDIYVGKAGRK
ncbi:MAG: class I SAM-dependent methyltransferase [Bacteroidia bacterium]|nr:class I SAM-dependent methyltransferase [Bacteroidia bacterium]